MTTFVVRCWGRVLGFFRRNLFFDIWSIGISAISADLLISSILSSQSKTITIPSPMWASNERVDGFSADPFIVKNDAWNYVFFEEMRYVNKVGKIKYYKLDERNNIIDEGDSISESFHMSYPNVFSVGGEYFLLPETNSDTTSLYKATSFPNQWVHYKTLFNIGMVDPTLFYYMNTWWILFSDNINDYIQIASSDDALRGQFKISDSRIFVQDQCNRMAGKPVVIDNKLYIFTKNSRVSYGGGLIVSELVGELNSCPKVSLIGEILPSPSHPHGINTINFSDNIVVFDGKRIEFVPIKIIIATVRCIMDFLNRLRKIQSLKRPR